MGWARFDDGYLDHPKILEVGPWAELLDMRAVIWCAKYDTDGLVTRVALKRLGREIPKVSTRVRGLVDVGRWLSNEGGGWLVHDFLKYNPSKAQRENDRESGRVRQASYRNRVRNAATDAFVPMGRGSVSLSTSPKMLARCDRCEKLSVDCVCAPSEPAEETP